MHAADVGDDHQIRPTDGCQHAHLAKMVHAHFQHQHLTVRSALADGHRQTNVVIIVLDGNQVLQKGSDYSVSYASNKNAGTAKMVIRGLGKYAGTKTVTFKIKAKSIKKLKLKKVKAQKYTGKKVKPLVTLKHGTYTLKKKKEFTVTYKKNVKRGTAVIVLKGKGNYTGQRKVTFKIR